MPKTVTINVTKPFVLTLDDATRVAYKRGTHQVDEATAAHWYVQAHVAPADAPDTNDLTAAELEATKLANQEYLDQIEDLKRQIADLTKDAKPAEPAAVVQEPAKVEAAPPAPFTPSPAASEFASDIAKVITENAAPPAPAPKKASK